VFQEATSNAVRHGRARAIQARLQASDEALVLTIVDDGTGFDPATARRGQGLEGMRARAIELGGEFEIASRHCEGTRITFRLGPVASLPN
jgi:signal transduction histidine kinase